MELMVKSYVSIDMERLLFWMDTHFVQQWCHSRKYKEFVRVTPKMSFASNRTKKRTIFNMCVLMYIQDKTGFIHLFYMTKLNGLKWNNEPLNKIIEIIARIREDWKINRPKLRLVSYVFGTEKWSSNEYHYGL